MGAFLEKKTMENKVDNPEGSNKRTTNLKKWSTSIIPIKEVWISNEIRPKSNGAPKNIEYANFFEENNSKYVIIPGIWREDCFFIYMVSQIKEIFVRKAYLSNCLL